MHQSLQGIELRLLKATGATDPNLPPDERLKSLALAVNDLVHVVEGLLNEQDRREERGAH